MLFNPRYGTVGLVAMPYHVVFEALGPLIELAGYVVALVAWVEGAIGLRAFALFLAVAFLYGLFLTLGSIALEDASLGRHPGWDDLGRLLVFAVAENLGYRQVSHLWKLEGFWQLVRKGEWGTMERRGLARTDLAPEVGMR
jgi:hypothetical protein